MSSRRSRLLRAGIALVPLACGLTLVPQVQTPLTAHAQTAPNGTPVTVCGTVSNFTAPAGTTAGSLGISSANANSTFPIAATATVSGATGLATGTSVCLVGVVDASGNLISGSLIPNASASVTICGPVTAYTPATNSGLGTLTVGGVGLVLGIGTTFSGTTVATGTNLCFAATVNGLGVITSGAVTTNTGTTASSTLTEACGTVSSFTAPTAAATGTLGLSGVNANSSFTFASGVTVSGATGVATGSNVCLLGAANAAGQLTSATLITNAPTQVTTCGVIGGFSAATSSAGGLLTVGSSTVALTTGASFTGGAITAGTTECVTLTLNALGQVSGGTVAVPLAAYPVYGPSIPGGARPGSVIPV